jgi:hypothetical protein
MINPENMINCKKNVIESNHLINEESNIKTIQANINYDNYIMNFLNSGKISNIYQYYYDCFNNNKREINLYLCLNKYGHEGIEHIKCEESKINYLLNN